MAVTLRNLMKHDWFKHTITLVTDETRAGYHGNLALYPSDG